MAPAIKVFSATDRTGPNCIGARVLDPERFLALVEREIQETGSEQRFDGVRRTILQLRSKEAIPLVSASYGPRKEPEKGAIYHQRGGETYLIREQAFPPLGCYVTVVTVEYYLRLRDETEPLPPEGASHVLLDVGVVDETEGRGMPGWSFPVADRDPNVPSLD